MRTLSTMESDVTAQELARAADRAEAAPWIDYPPTPAWYPLSAGLWAGGLVLAVTLLDGWAQSLALVGLVALEGVFLAWYRRYRGALPTGWMPAELRPAALWFVAGCAAVAGVAVGLTALDWPVLAAVAALVLTTALVAWYERAFATAAAATRARLG